MTLVRKRQIKLTPEDELVALTRDLERLKREKRKWARKLKATVKELSAVKKEHKALLTQVKLERTGPDVMPSRLTAGVTGYQMPPNIDQIVQRATDAADAFVEEINDGKEEKVR